MDMSSDVAHVIVVMSYMDMSSDVTLVIVMMSYIDMSSDVAHIYCGDVKYGNVI